MATGIVVQLIVLSYIHSQPNITLTFRSILLIILSLFVNKKYLQTNNVETVAIIDNRLMSFQSM